VSVVAGQTFTQTLLATEGTLPDGLGARVETPVIRAIVSAFTPATFADGVWSVTLDSPMFPGSYNLVWLDGLDPPTVQIFVPLLVGDVGVINAIGGVDYPLVSLPANLEQVVPTTDEIAMLERVRCVGPGGADEGTFTDDTRPTVTEVTKLIGQATDQVLAQLREAFDPQHYGQVKHAITLWTAILIEGSFFREQASDRTPLWQALYTETMTSLQSRVDADLTQALVVGVMEPRPPGWNSSAISWLNA